MNETKLFNAFEAVYGRDAALGKRCFFAPGRVCLLGEHLDYNNAVVLPASIALGISAVYRPTLNHVLCISSLQQEKEMIIDLESPIVYQQGNEWGNYVLGVYRSFAEKGWKLSGAEILFHSDLPVGAGLSSSAALTVLTAFILNTVLKADYTKKKLAEICRKVENDFIGVNCGLMDPLAIALGKKDYLISLDCATEDFEYIPLDLAAHSCALVVFNTNKSRELAASAFNERVEECQNALEQISNKKGELLQWRDIGQDALNLLEDPTLKKRGRHLLTEIQRVSEAEELLKKGELKAFGQLMTQSHRSLKDDFEVSCPELDFFVESAIKEAGCMGAKMTGAGFGGCAIALIAQKQVPQFMQHIEKAYYVQTGLQGKAFVTTIDEGVRELCE
ncbi:MAG: galactokinase [Chitinophagales bacterium]